MDKFISAPIDPEKLNIYDDKKILKLPLSKIKVKDLKPIVLGKSPKPKLPPPVPPAPSSISKYPQIKSNEKYTILNIPMNIHKNPYSVLLDVSSDLIKNCANVYQNNNNIQIIDKIISNGKQGAVKYACTNKN